MKSILNGLRESFSIYHLKVGLLLLLSLSGVLGISTITHASSNDAFTGIAGKCIDVRGGKAISGAKVQLYKCNNTVAQAWNIPGDGTIRSRGLCLDVKGGNKASKTALQLYSCNDTKSQQWNIHSNGTITSTLSGLCIDDSYGITKNKNPLWMYSCNTSVSQTWSSATIKQLAATEAATIAAQKAAQEQAAQAAASASAAAAAAQNSSQGNSEGYTNSAGNYVRSPSSDPQGATAKCQDGTYSYSQSRRGTCSHHGGVAQWL